MEELTKQEESELKGLEHTIQTTRGAFVACGEALKVIQEKRLYRKDFANFDDYCKQKWGWSRIRAHQLIQAAETVKSLDPKVLTMVNNERKVREISKISPEKREAALERARRSGDTTARGIKKSAKELEEQHIDRTGYPIPYPLVQQWDKAKELGERLSRMASEVRTNFEDVADTDITVEVNSSSVIAALKNAYNELKRIIPHAVCPSCQGHPKKCGLCKNRGWVSKFTWDTVVPEETKKIRGDK